MRSGRRRLRVRQRARATVDETRVFFCLQRSDCKRLDTDTRKRVSASAWRTTPPRGKWEHCARPPALSRALLLPPPHAAMSDVHVGAVVHRISRDPATFASLPLPLVHRIFLALPVQARGRASCVCRAWRAVMAEPAVWTRLDLAGVRVAWGQSLDSVLLNVSGRSHNTVVELDLLARYVQWEHLLPVLTANAGSLRELHLLCVRPHLDRDRNGIPSVEEVVAAAPLLQVLTVEHTSCTSSQAPRVLRSEPPFARLQTSGFLNVCFEEDVADEAAVMADFRPFADALADVTLKPALKRFRIHTADTAQPALMGALADAVVARRLPELWLVDCTPPAAAPLARLLAEGSLAVFNLHPQTRFDHHVTLPQFDLAGATLVADALRVNTTLTELELRAADLCVDVRVACALLGGLVGHRSLRELRLSGEETADADWSVLGAALAALIAADAPALKVLWYFDYSERVLGDAGMAPIVEALPLNRHLRVLDLRCSGMSEAFARDRLLPAVRANTTLRKFTYSSECDDEDVPAAAEAVELVNRRGQHD